MVAEALMTRDVSAHSALELTPSINVVSGQRWRERGSNSQTLDLKTSGSPDGLPRRTEDGIRTRKHQHLMLAARLLAYLSLRTVGGNRTRKHLLLREAARLNGLPRLGTRDESRTRKHHSLSVAARQMAYPSSCHIQLTCI